MLITWHKNNKNNPTLFTVSGVLSLGSSGILTMYLEVSPNWEWVGSLLTVGTNVKIRGLASESPEETYETRNKLDFQSCQRFILTLFSTYYGIYLAYFDKLPTVLWSCDGCQREQLLKYSSCMWSIFFMKIFISERKTTPGRSYCRTQQQKSRLTSWASRMLQVNREECQFQHSQTLCLWWPHRSHGLSSI